MQQRRLTPAICGVSLLLSFCQGRNAVGAQTLLRADFSKDVGGWSNKVLCNTGSGILAYIGVATPLRHQCTRRSSNLWDAVVVCEVQGEDAGGLESSETNVATQRIISSKDAITIKTADATAVPVEKETWYFTSPLAWSQDISQAFDGFLLIRIVHRVIPVTTRVPGRKDVILTARCGYYLWHELPIDVGVSGRTHKLQLNAESGWIDSRTGSPPTRKSFFGVLSHLRDIKIRGGYYYGYEATSLVVVEILKGDVPFPCCSSRGDVTTCSLKPSPFLTDPNTRFPCEGESHEVIRVHQVIPRFARRTGGATITVIGENFGIAGTHPIVRVGGHACTRTQFWVPPPHCRNNLTDTQLGETGMDRGGPCYPEECFNGVLDAALFELEADCGGRCRACPSRKGRTRFEPSQLSMLECLMPAFADKDMPPPVALHVEGQAEASDLPVTVEAAGRWMPILSEHRLDPSMQMSCITPEARGFQLGGLGAVWGAHIFGNGSQVTISDVSFVLEIGGGGGGGGSGGGGNSYGVGTVTGELHLGSLAAGAAPFSAGGGPTVRANGASNSSGSAAASNSSGGAAASSTNSTTQARGFVVKRDAAGGVVWVCQVSSRNLTGSEKVGANISLHSVAPGAPTVGGAGGYVGGVLQTGLGGMGPAFAGQEHVAAYKDEGVYVAGVFTAERVGVRDIYVECSSGSEQFAAPPPVSLAIRDLGGNDTHGGFVLRFFPTGYVSWLQAPLPGVSGTRRLSNVRLAPWLSIRPETLAAHGIAAAAGEGRWGGEVGAGVYVVAQVGARAGADAEDVAADVARVWVERYSRAALMNLTRVAGDGALIALLHGDAGAVAWVRVVSGHALSLDLGVPSSGVSRSSPADTLLYLPASWATGALTVQSCRFDVRVPSPAEALPPWPAAVAAVPPTLADLELEMPPHMQCYRGAPRGFAFRAPCDLILTGVRWPDMPAPCVADVERARRVLQVQVALMEAGTPAPAAGVTWTKDSNSFKLLVNFSGPPPPDTAQPLATTATLYPDAPNGGAPNGGGGGWITFEHELELLRVPAGRTVAIWGHMDGYSSYAGSPSRPSNGVFAAYHLPTGNGTGNISLWRLAAGSMSAGTSLSLEAGPSFGRWRLAYRLAPMTTAATSSSTPPPNITSAPLTTPSPAAATLATPPSSAPADAAELLRTRGVVCEQSVSPPDLYAEPFFDADRAKVGQVLEVFGDTFGEGFVAALLYQMDQSVERVVAALNNQSIPQNLLGIDRSAPFRAKYPSEYLCDNKDSWPHERLHTANPAACRLAAPAGASSALVFAISGTGEVEWVRTAVGGDVRLKALAHSQDAAVVGVAAAAAAAGASRASTDAPIEWLRNVMREAAAADSVVVVGEVRGAALADWGRSVWPLECSRGKVVGQKGLSGLHALSACSGQVRGQGASGKSDVLVVRMRASDGAVGWLRRTGLAEREESAADVALDTRGYIYVLGAFSPQAAGLAQGKEDVGEGSDVFGLAAARRLRMVGCDADRRRDKVGLPLCTMRAHSSSDDGSRGPTTAFLLQMAGDSRYLEEGSSGRKKMLSLMGYVLSQPSASTIRLDSGLPRVPLDDAYKGLVLEVVDGSGRGYIGTILAYTASTHQVVVQPALSSADLLDGSSLIQVALTLTGRVSELGSDRNRVRMDGSLFVGKDDLYTGMLLRIRSGPAAGYEGIIGRYHAATRTASEFVPPTLPEPPTADSVWQIVPSAPFTARNSLAECSLPNDIACGSEGIVWARTLGYAQASATGDSTDARSQGVALAASGAVNLVVGGSMRGFEKGGSRFSVPGIDDVGVHTCDAASCQIPSDNFLISLQGS